MILGLFVAALLFCFIRWELAAPAAIGFFIAGPLGSAAVLLTGYLYVCFFKV